MESHLRSSVVMGREFSCFYLSGPFQPTANPTSELGHRNVLPTPPARRGHSAGTVGEMVQTELLSPTGRTSLFTGTGRYDIMFLSFTYRRKNGPRRSLLTAIRFVLQKPSGKAPVGEAARLAPFTTTVYPHLSLLIDTSRSPLSQMVSRGTLRQLGHLSWWPRQRPMVRSASTVRIHATL